MTENGKILVGINHEDAHDRILEDGFAFAKIMDSDIDAVFISELPQDQVAFIYTAGMDIMGPVDWIDEEEMERIRSTIKESVERIGTDYGKPFKLIEEEGNPAQTMVEMSKNYNYVVIGSEIDGIHHGKHLGPNARNIVRFAESPVLVVRDWKDTKKLKDIQRILVPVDGSDISNFAAAHAATIAEKVKGKVTILHVWDKKHEKLIKKIKIENIDESEIVTMSTKKILDDAESTMIANVPIEREVVHGDPSEVITTASRENDLIVMGTWGRGGIKKFLLGGTAENVAQHAECPVLLVRGIPDE